MAFWMPRLRQAMSAGHLQIETLQPMLRFAAPEATPAAAIVLTAHQAALLGAVGSQQESVTAIEVLIQHLKNPEKYEKKILVVDVNTNKPEGGKPKGSELLSGGTLAQLVVIQVFILHDGVALVAVHIPIFAFISSHLKRMHVPKHELVNGRVMDQY